MFFNSFFRYFLYLTGTKFILAPKYREKGEEGLSDRRGRRKKDEELDELGLLKKQLREKERELERAHLEIRLLKKVEEIERRGYAEQADSRMNIRQSRKKTKR